MARLKASEMDKFYTGTVEAIWLGRIYVIQYPQSQLNFIAFSYDELLKELKKVKSGYTPTISVFETFGKPTVKKLPVGTVKKLIKE